MSKGIKLIAAERKRQIEQEGWTPKHDDQHTFGQLSVAAACYAVAGVVRPGDSDWLRVVDPRGNDAWPWMKKWDKRRKHVRIRRLVIAGALIAAEIDRLNREAG